MLDGESAAGLAKVRRFECTKEQHLLLMSKRISVLEDALHVSCETGEAHPLLTTELLCIKQRVNRLEEVEDRQVEETDWVDGGTLMMSGRKDMRYVGASATEVGVASC